MITILDGVPGSGKSYYAVQAIAKNFCAYDEFSRQYLLKPNVCLITNIEGLKLNNMNLDLLIKEYELNRVFSLDYFKHLKEKFSHVILIIDEAQKYFNKYNWESISFAFQYHRHLGLDIYIITQDVSLLPRGLTVLAEYIISARPRSLKIGGFFLYDFQDITKRLRLFSKHLRYKKAIFNLYSSYQFDETQKPKSAILHWGLIALVIIIISIFGFRYVIFHMWGRTANATPERSLIASNPKPIPVPVPTPSPSAIVQPKPSMEVKSYSTPLPLPIYDIVGEIEGDLLHKYMLPDGSLVSDGDCWRISNSKIQCNKVLNTF